MAGIGFELRKLLDKGGLLFSLQAWITAGLVSSGPWIISILGVFAIGMLAGTSGLAMDSVSEFQVSVTSLMASSLILSGPAQLLFTRFAADRFYEDRQDMVVPNLFGVMLLMTAVSASIGGVLATAALQGSVLYRLLMWSGFVIICNLWVVVVLLAAIKRWQPVLISFALVYTAIVIGAIVLRDHGVIGPLSSFVFGHGVMLFLLTGAIIRACPATELVRFDVLNSSLVFPSLAFTGLFYNLGIWADKFLFWYNPLTGEEVNGVLHYSLIYDQPIFLAYLSIVPGMAVFLLRVETDFAECYHRFYKEITHGGSMSRILAAKEKMVKAIYSGIREIIKVQGITVVVLIILGGQFLDVFGISRLHQSLLSIDLVAVSVQVVLLAVLNMLFYFDQRQTVLLVAAMFMISNLGFTMLSQHLGPAWYGLGFAAAVILSSLTGLVLLGRRLKELEYETFMRRKVNI